MNAAAAVDPALLAAWRASEYRVATASGTLVLRIDERSPALADLMRRARTDRAAYISADNPMSRLATAAANARARTRLREALQAGGWQVLPGVGIDPAGSHPGEESLLVLGIAPDEAIGLGRTFGQYAILLIGADATPRLAVIASP